MWYHIVAGQPQGPVDDATLDRMAAEGSVSADTLIWKEGMAQWTPLGQLRAVAAGGAPGLVGRETCTLCGKSVDANDLIDLVGQRVCAACKPTAVQKMREGVPLTGIGDAWRDKKAVVTRDEAVLPPRCFKCNRPAYGAPIKRKVYWHNPLIFILIFLHFIIYVIVALIVRKRGTVQVSLCEEHTQRRKMFIAAGWGSLVLSVIVMTIGIALHSPLTVIGGVLLLVVLGLVAIYHANIVRTAKITDKTIWLRGAGKDFVASLPEWPG